MLVNNMIANIPSEFSVESGGALSISLQGVSKRYGDRPVLQQLSLDMPAGQIIVIVGPSGCGKSTLLRLLAGFIAPDSGRILFGGQQVQHLAPEKRPTALVFQNYALWPHRTVFEHIAFGLRIRKWKRRQITERVHAMLELTDLVGLEQRYPGQLSGGQQQRVALARSLAIAPSILLLDEPLSNLDAQIRQQMRSELRTMQQRLGITTVYVTHDQEEALSMADRVVVMQAGRIEQYASPLDVYRHPATPFVARFIGRCNILRGKVIAQDEVLVLVQLLRKDEVNTNQSEAALVVAVPRRNWISSTSPQIGEIIVAAIKPEDIRISEREEASGIIAPLVGEKQSESFVGTGWQLTMKTAYGSLTAVMREALSCAPSSQYQPGASLAVSLNTEHILLWRDETREQ